MKRTIILCIALTAAAAWGADEPRRFEATRDVWVSAFEGECDFNMGAAKTIKLKMYQEFGILDFDVSALKGRRVTEAWLFVKPVGKVLWDRMDSLDAIRWMTASTVGHGWVEGKSTDYAKDPAGLGATWNESSFTQADWGWPGATLGDVAFGNGNTLRTDGRAEPTADKWLKLKLDPGLVQALVAGASHGLLVQEGNGAVKLNAVIAQRESGSPAYLLVTASAPDTTPPAKPAGLAVAPAPKLATATQGAILLTLQVPDGAFAWRVKVNGKDVERWQIPFAAKAGATQSFPVLDLPAGEKVTVEVSAVDAAGNESPAATATGAASGALAVPALPACPFRPASGSPSKLGGAKVWAAPEVTKIDPVTGEVLHEEAAEGFRKANPVWDGATGTVRLAAARGEIVSFQLAFEGKLAAATVAVSALKGPGEIPASGVRLWRNWYVGREAEIAVPLAGAFDVPAADNAVEGQTLQAITVDIHVPAATPPGDYAGTATVSAGEAKLAVPVKIKVYPVTIPDAVFFNPELNCYGGPGYSSSPKFKDSFKLAHYHRSTINRVPYNQRQPGASGDWSPKLDATGRIADWSAYDRDMGPLLDGSLFAGNPRAGVPVPTMYLPLNLGWPLDYRKYYRPGEGLGTYFNNDYIQKLTHDLQCRPVEQAMDPAWGEAFTAAVKEFDRHFREKGWLRTQMQYYLNRKWSWGYSAWTLDEPVTTLDWIALRYFGRIFVDAVGDPEIASRAWHENLFARGLSGMNRDRPTFLFRTDISRPVPQGSIHDGLASVMYVNSGQFNHPRLMRGHKMRMPAVLYAYGACNAVDRSNWESAAWCLKAYAHHGDGVLPWQSLGDQSALTKANTEALIVDASRAGKGHALASLRVHALRRGAQDCELLRLLQLRNGWSREHVGMLVSQKVPLTSAFQQKFSDQAAAVTFGSLTARGFCELKEGVLQLLAQDTGKR